MAGTDPAHRSGGPLELVQALGRRVGARALDLVYPSECRECGAALAGGSPLCPACAAQVRWIASSCPRCGLPAANPGPDSCGSCAGRLLFLDRAAAPAEYEGPWRTLVLRFKYLGDQAARPPIARALERVYRERFAAESPAALVPVPAHPFRRLTRGRDPVDELALDLAARIGLRLLRALRRARWTPSQTSLTRSRRLRNPRGAYALRRRLVPPWKRPALPGTVVLLDDVFTTGATVSECARALKEAGARRVLVLAAARSLD